MWRRLSVCLSWWLVARLVTLPRGVGKYPNPRSPSTVQLGSTFGWLAQRAKGRGRPSFRGQAPSWVPCPFPSPGLPCTQWEAPSSYSPTATFGLDFPNHLEGTLLSSSATQLISVVRTSVSEERWPNSRLLWASVSPTCRMTYSDWSSSFQAFIKATEVFFKQTGMRKYQ